MNTKPHPTSPQANRRWTDTSGLSAHCGIPKSTLMTWRCTEPDRIPFHRCGRKVLYDLNEVDAALAGPKHGV